MIRQRNLFQILVTTDPYSAVGAGPGLGMEAETQKAMFRLLSGLQKTSVLDADALNILSLNKEWLSLLPPGNYSYSPSKGV